MLRLHKALYGLHQAPRAWNAKLDTTLVSLGFTRCSEEHDVYIRGEGRCRLLLGIYVDDLILTGIDTGELRQFKEEMKNSFKMSDLGLLSYYLGIEVQQHPEMITLGQSAYAAKLLEKACLADCNPVHAPMENRLKLSTSSTAPEVDATLYRSFVGSLRYLIHTRPDITFAVEYVSRFMEKPTTEHLNAVKHILRYIAGTLHFGCCYRKNHGDVVVTGYRTLIMSGI